MTTENTDNVVDFNTFLKSKLFGEVYDRLIAAYQEQNEKHPSLAVANYIIISNSIAGQLYAHVDEGQLKRVFLEGLACQLFSLNKIREKKGQKRLSIEELLR